jgi:hypothetical protein
MKKNYFYSVLVLILLLFLFIDLSIAQPVVTLGTVANNVTGVISARWRGLNNNGGVNTAMYIGNSNIGVGANRVEVGGNGFFNKPSNTNISFIYDKAADRLLGTVASTLLGTQTITFSSVSTKLLVPAALCRMNYMTLLVRNLGVTSTGITAFNNVQLNGNALGSFSTTPNSTTIWTVSNFDFSQSFTVTGTIALDAGLYGAAENAKVELSIGERRPISTISTSTICATSPLVVNLTGLLPNNTYTIDYTFLGSTVTPVFTTNSSGTANFTTAVVSQPNMGQILTINTLTPSAPGACSWAAIVNNTVAALDDPICAIILPVQLIHFSGQAQLSNDALKWIIKEEEEMEYYQIQVSEDAINWQNSYKTSAINALQETNNYSFNHPKLFLKRYYRLQLVTKEKAIYYSKIILLQDEKTTDPIIIYPNPTSDVVTIRQSKNESIQITIWSIDGRLLKEETSNENEVKISLSNWAKATYILQIKTPNAVVNYYKLVKW